MKKGILALYTIIALASCDKSKVNVKGSLPCSAGETLYLDVVTPSKERVVDSVVLGDKGEFSFKVKLPEDEASIYNLRANTGIIPLLLEVGDNVEVNAVGNIVRTYSVTGSRSSALVKELSAILNEGTFKLDSLSKLYAEKGGSNETLGQEILKEYSAIYYGTKRKHVEFIVKNSSSLAAVYGLYQRLPNSDAIVNNDTDIVYYRMVADSAGAKYPNSSYIAALKREIKDYEDRFALIQDMSKAALDGTNSIPNITMPNLLGEMESLSDVKSKVVLIDFWSAEMADCNLNNAEYKKLYEKYDSKDLEIFQVAVDVDKPVWVNSVIEQKLPWITLCDFKGRAGQAVQIYNVKSVPMNYLVVDGEIVDKNIYGDKLDSKIKQLMEK